MQLPSQEENPETTSEIPLCPKSFGPLIFLSPLNNTILGKGINLNQLAQYPILVLKSGRDRSIRNRHPWVFSGGVKQRPKASTGDIVAVHSNKGELLAYGHYAPDAALICRLFAFGEEERDINDAFWRNKLQLALRYRKESLHLGDTNGYRLVHAEGDGMPGVVLDLYGNAASLQLRTKGAQALLPLIQEFLVEEIGIEHLFLRKEKRKGQPAPGEWILGGLEQTTFRENGLSFLVDIEGGQKTGFFIDQRDNRALLREYSEGRTLLNAFSYSGAFSVAALAGNAKSVTSVDISAQAVEEARQNVTLNFGEVDHHEAVKADCFQYLKEMEDGRFDLIVLDPPAFTKHIRTVDKAARGYKEINLKAFQKIAPGGLLFTYSCSQHISKDLFRKIVFGAAADAGREVRIVCQMGQSPDHPVSIYHPEGEYLKGLLLQVE